MCRNISIGKKKSLMLRFFLRKNQFPTFDIMTLLLGGSILTSYFLKWYFTSSPKQKKLVKDFPDAVYIRKQKAAWLRFLKVEGKNANVEAAFYDKEKYNKIVAEKENVLEAAWKQRILYESTPLGNVIMYYDAYKKAFSYHADISIPYAVLNAVAMKYVVFFRCGDFFIDNSVSACESPFAHEHEIDVVAKKKETTKKNDKFDVRKGPFAKLKRKNDKKGLESGPGSGSSLESKEKEKNVVKNKFVFLGKSRDFNFLKRGDSTAKKETTTTSVLPMKYGDFKKSWHFPNSETFHEEGG